MFLKDATVAMRDRGSDGFEEIFRGEFGCVCGGEQDSVGAKEREDGGDKSAVVLFGLENTGLRMRKGGRVEENQVEEAGFFCEARSPIEEIAEDEIVRGGIEVVKGEVALAPIEIFFGEVETGGAGAGERGTDGEGAGVGEGVQDFTFGEGMSSKRVKCGAM